MEAPRTRDSQSNAPTALTSEDAVIVARLCEARRRNSPANLVSSNTYWDWLINQVGGVYGMMDEVFKFTATFKEYPPRSTPPSFNPANLLEQTIREIKAKRKLEEAFPMLRDASEKPEK